MEPEKIQSNRAKALHVRSYILQNLEQSDLGLSELSRRFFITSKTLNREFKKQFQLTVQDFIRDERLKRAYELLKLGQQVREVYQLVGFRHAESFSKALKRKFGISPGAIVKQ